MSKNNKTIKINYLFQIILAVFFLFSEYASGQSMPKLSPEKFVIYTDSKPTNVQVKKGDFICFVVEGVIRSKNFIYNGCQPSQVGSSCHQLVPPAGNNLLPNTYTKYKELPPRALLMEQGNKVYASYALSDGEEDLLAIVGTMLGIGYGNYFVADADGPIKLLINDNNILEGAFGVEIYMLEREQHINRNKFNNCPNEMYVKQTVSVSTLFGEQIVELKAYDENGNNWYKDQPVIELKYHGGMPTFRGLESNSGSQCSYKKNFNVISSSTRTNNFGQNRRTEKRQYYLEKSDGLTIGTFDFSYYGGNIERVFDFVPYVKTHFIFDIYPHRAYLREDSNFKYKGTLGY